VIVTQVSTPSQEPVASSSPGTGIPAGASESASPANRDGGGGGGLSPAGTIAIAVVIPIVAIAILVFAGLFFWRRRKQRKDDEDERRKEMEAYGFNPNNDPTLPVVGGMSEDGQSGYRGWGGGTAVGTMSNRKASTTLSSGAGNPAAYSPGSPNTGTDASGEALMGGAGAGAGVAAVAGAQSHSHSRNATMDSDTVGGAYANMHSSKGVGVQRGPSNASSTYSMGGASHASNDAPIPVSANEQYYSDYYQSGPYDNAYGAGGNEAVIRDNPARRNTRIERAPTFPNQGSSGVATNF
jgi:hypothetical protein